MSFASIGNFIWVSSKTEHILCNWDQCARMDAFEIIEDQGDVVKPSRFALVIVAITPKRIITKLETRFFFEEKRLEQSSALSLWKIPKNLPLTVLGAKAFEVEIVEQTLDTIDIFAVNTSLYMKANSFGEIGKYSGRCRR